MSRLPIRNARVKPKDRRSVVPKAKVAEDFYGSAPWKELRERLRKERGGRCETPGCQNHGRVILHHIVERKDGGAPLDPRNLVFQCDPCHGRVTAANRQLRINEVEQVQDDDDTRSPPAQTGPRVIRLG
jgi:5-methylcytosine-specific restriction endonuclease McrA